MAEITRELREWANTFWGCGGKSHYAGDLLAIADRIDAEHERACAEAYGNGAMSVPIAVDESKWVKLPMDADGVPIRVGDHVEETDTSLIGRARGEVIRIVFGKHGTDVRIDTGLSYADRSPWSLRHISKPPTVEDVLTDFLDAYQQYEGDGYDVVAKYAARLQLADDYNEHIREK